MTRLLEGKVALVAGATRGAGRGIAQELGAAGAKVYCTGRSTRGRPATPNRPETIEETSELIGAAGGSAVAIRVDHQVEAEVEALAARIAADDGRLDILVNNIWGGDEAINWGERFWTLDIATVRALVDQAIISHLITARHLAPMMVAAGQGLIIEVTDGELAGYRGHLLYDLVKASLNRLAYAMAWDLQGTGVVALAVSPGFLRSEAVLDRLGVSEANWRDAVKLVPNDDAFEHSETPRYVGRGIAALAADPQVSRRAGRAVWGADLAQEYGFADVDGRQPDFWRDIEAGLERDFAGDGDLTAEARRMAAARYMSIHNTAAYGAQARRYAAWLGWTTLGEGLQPIGGPFPLLARPFAADSKADSGGLRDPSGRPTRASSRTRSRRQRHSPTACGCG